ERAGGGELPRSTFRQRRGLGHRDRDQRRGGDADGGRIVETAQRAADHGAAGGDGEREAGRVDGDDRGIQRAPGDVAAHVLHAAVGEEPVGGEAGGGAGGEAAGGRGDFDAGEHRIGDGERGGTGDAPQRRRDGGGARADAGRNVAGDAGRSLGRRPAHLGRE